MDNNNRQDEFAKEDERVHRSLLKNRRNRSLLSAVGVGAMIAVGIAIGVGATIYHNEILGLFQGNFGSEPANAQEAASAPEQTSSGVDQMNPDISATTGRLGSTPFVQHAEEAGITTCSNLFVSLGDSLTGGSSYGVQSFWNQQAPDEQAIEALVGLDYQSDSYAGPAAGYVFASPSDGGCEGAMVRVAPYQAACGDIPAILPEGSVRLNELGEVAFYDLSSGGQALLLPIGETCAVVSIASGSQIVSSSAGEPE